MPQLSQAAIVGGVILVAFVLYLAMNSRFPAYYAVLMGAPGSGGAPSGGSGSTAPSLDPTSPNFNPLGAGQSAGAAVRDWLKHLFGG